MLDGPRGTKRNHKPEIITGRFTFAFFESTRALGTSSLFFEATSGRGASFGFSSGIARYFAFLHLDLVLGLSSSGFLGKATSLNWDGHGHLKR